MPDGGALASALMVTRRRRSEICAWQCGPTKLYRLLVLLLLLLLVVVVVVAAVTICSSHQP